MVNFENVILTSSTCLLGQLLAALRGCPPLEFQLMELWTAAIRKQQHSGDSWSGSTKHKRRIMLFRSLVPVGKRKKNLGAATEIKKQSDVPTSASYVAGALC